MISSTDLAPGRIAMGVEYDGSHFRGWQRQEAGVRSVQGVLEQALSRVADHPLTLHCAGRTDAGVHASAQVVHFDTHSRRSERAWVLGANANLPDDVAAIWARSVATDFHARFSARARRYRYRIHNRPVRLALDRLQSVWCHWPLDAQRMQEAGLALLGEHDFSGFRAVGCQSRSPIRRITELTVQREGERIILEVEANAFLHHMVRNIAGVLMAIGRGEQPVGWAAQVLAQRDRRRGGVTAPGHGLCLTGVRYPAIHALPGIQA